MATILLIEDDPHALEMLRFRFEKAGYKVVEALDGDDGLVKALHKPDLILMDIQLPEISGLDVTRQLKADESLKTIPVIAVTAFAMKGDEQKIREGGCEDYISKPISVTRFLEVIDNYLKKP